MSPMIFARNLECAGADRLYQRGAGKTQAFNGQKVKGQLQFNRDKAVYVGVLTGCLPSGATSLGGSH
jgi:hypothetical protein